MYPGCGIYISKTTAKAAIVLKSDGDPAKIITLLLKEMYGKESLKSKSALGRRKNDHIPKMLFDADNYLFSFNFTPNLKIETTDRHTSHTSIS